MHIIKIGVHFSLVLNMSRKKKTLAPSEFPESLLWAENCCDCSQFREGKIPALVAVCRSTLNDHAL